MDFIDLFKKVADLFVYYWSLRLPINGYNITVGAVFIFCGIAGIIIKFVRGLAE